MMLFVGNSTLLPRLQQAASADLGYSH